MQIVENQVVMYLIFIPRIKSLKIEYKVIRESIYDVIYTVSSLVLR
jgi:hypothetical protein